MRFIFGKIAIEIAAGDSKALSTWELQEKKIKRSKN